MTYAIETDQWLDQLASVGYCIIPDLLPKSILGDLEADLESDFQQTPFGQGDFYGYRTKRLRADSHGDCGNDIETGL